MKLFGMCIDKRVVVGVTAAAGLLWWQAPGAFAAALPLLVFAVCPLSMLLMMKAMNQMGGEKSPATPPSAPPPAPAAEVSPADGVTVVSAEAAAADVQARLN